MRFDNRDTVATRRIVAPPGTPSRDSWAVLKGMALGVTICTMTAAFVVPAIYGLPHVSTREVTSQTRAAAPAENAKPQPALDTRTSKADDRGQATAVAPLPPLGKETNAKAPPCNQQTWPNIDRSCLKNDSAAAPMPSPPIRDVTPRRDAPAPENRDERLFGQPEPPGSAREAAAPTPDARPQVPHEETRASRRAERRAARRERERMRRYPPGDVQGDATVVERMPRGRALYGLFRDDDDDVVVRREPRTRYYRGLPEQGF